MDLSAYNLVIWRRGSLQPGRGCVIHLHTSPADEGSRGIFTLYIIIGGLYVERTMFDLLAVEFSACDNGIVVLPLQ